ncbi:MAG: hypothetical protein HYR91_03880 [Flavobacteriia bacterium]|nr:hypothetical protein [Flavobacteriia bacterium]
MKIFLSLILINVILFSFISSGNRHFIGTTWILKTILVKNDTVFSDGNKKLTIKFFLEMDKDFLSQNNQNGERKMIENNAIKKYDECKKIRLQFISDSTFIITKIRPGGKIFSNEIDSGVYKQTIDSLFLVVPKRNNYPYNFKIYSDKLSCIDKHPINPKTTLEFYQSKH